jgi:hypothetical protein
MMKNRHTYTVRPLGQAAWAEHVTLRQAIRDATDARDQGLRQVVIVRESDGVIVGNDGMPAHDTATD